MNINSVKTIAAQRYDQALLGSQKKRSLPADVPEPQPSAAWSEENITLLARYWVWLEEENSTQNCIEQIYIPMAGHVLGLNLKPHPQLDLDKDLERTLDYIKAKQLSHSWVDTCRRALNRFRRFLRYERGLLVVSFVDEDVCVARYHEGLPGWFIEHITHMQHLRQVNWRPSRLPDAIRRFWGGHTRLWRWLFAQGEITEPKDIKRRHIFAYIDERLAAGSSSKTINQDLRAFQATLRFLQERDFHIPLSLLRLPMLKEPDALPRFLTDEEVCRLQSDFEQRLARAGKPAERRDALLDRAVFYLLWHGGMRLGEVEELCLADLNLGQRQLVVRQGKGMKDRTVYLSDVAVAALADYLTVRGQGQTDHVFLFRHRPLCKGFIHLRIKLAGKRAGVKVTSHQLRHTCATQLVNAGCPITTIKEILGHRRLNSTMVYARVHDRTVAEDYFAAMAVIEKRLEPHLRTVPEQGIVRNVNGQRKQEEIIHPLLALVDDLSDSDLNGRQRQLVTELRQGILAISE